MRITSARGSRRRAVGARRVAAYADRVISLEDPGLTSVEIVNAKRSGTVVVDAAALSGLFEVTVFDCFGEVRSRSSVRLDGDVYRFNVPPSGMVSLRARDQEADR